MSMRILVVEDNFTLRRLYHKVIEHIDAEVSEANSLKTATELLRARSFDLLICDIEMEDGNMLDTIRSSIEKGVPVIAVSAYEEYKEACDNMGVIAFLEKPFPTRQLSELIMEHFDFTG